MLDFNGQLAEFNSGRCNSGSEREKDVIMSFSDPTADTPSLCARSITVDSCSFSTNDDEDYLESVTTLSDHQDRNIEMKFITMASIGKPLDELRRPQFDDSVSVTATLPADESISSDQNLEPSSLSNFMSHRNEDVISLCNSVTCSEMPLNAVFAMSLNPEEITVGIDTSQLHIEKEADTPLSEVDPWNSLCKSESGEDLPCSDLNVAENIYTPIDIQFCPLKEIIFDVDIRSLMSPVIAFDESEGTASYESNSDQVSYLLREKTCEISISSTEPSTAEPSTEPLTEPSTAEPSTAEPSTEPLTEPLTEPSYIDCNSLAVIDQKEPLIQGRNRLVFVEDEKIQVTRSYVICHDVLEYTQYEEKSLLPISTKGGGNDNAVFDIMTSTVTPLNAGDIFVSELLEGSGCLDIETNGSMANDQSVYSGSDDVKNVVLAVEDSNTESICRKHNRIEWMREFWLSSSTSSSSDNLHYSPLSFKNETQCPLLTAILLNNNSNSMCQSVTVEPNMDDVPAGYPIDSSPLGIPSHVIYGTQGLDRDPIATTASTSSDDADRDQCKGTALLVSSVDLIEELNVSASRLLFSTAQIDTKPIECQCIVVVDANRDHFPDINSYLSNLETYNITDTILSMSTSSDDGNVYVSCEVAHLTQWKDESRDPPAVYPSTLSTGGYENRIMDAEFYTQIGTMIPQQNDSILSHAKSETWPDGPIGNIPDPEVFHESDCDGITDEFCFDILTSSPMIDRGNAAREEALMTNHPTIAQHSIPTDLIMESNSASSTSDYTVSDCLEDTTVPCGHTNDIFVSDDCTEPIGCSISLNDHDDEYILSPESYTGHYKLSCFDGIVLEESSNNPRFGTELSAISSYRENLSFSLSPTLQIDIPVVSSKLAPTIEVKISKTPAFSSSSGDLLRCESTKESCSEESLTTNQTLIVISDLFSPRRGNAGEQNESATLDSSNQNSFQETVVSTKNEEFDSNSHDNGPIVKTSPLKVRYKFILSFFKLT